jgi:hypothetical protein
MSRLIEGMRNFFKFKVSWKPRASTYLWTEGVGLYRPKGDVGVVHGWIYVVVHFVNVTDRRIVTETREVDKVFRLNVDALSNSATVDTS